MKTPVLVGIVVGLHCVVLGSLVFLGGCGTPGVASSQPPKPILPEPVQVTEVAQEQATIVRPSQQQWPKETTTYIVRKGDTLSVIANRFDVKMSELVRINGIANPNRIRAGEKLLIPGNVDVGPLPQTQTSTVRDVGPATPLGPDGTYVVKSGDSLSVIAARYGTTTKELRDANGLKGDKILVNQKLIIPGVSSTEVEVPDQELPSRDVVPEVSAPPTGPAKVHTLPQKDVMSTYVIVQDGDDLATIAGGYNISVARLREFNNLQSDKLTPGQRLRIPSE